MAEVAEDDEAERHQQHQPIAERGAQQGGEGLFFRHVPGDDGEYASQRG